MPVIVSLGPPNGQDRTYHAQRRTDQMGKLLLFGAGVAIGYALGARGGRQAYDDLVETAQKIRDNPTVQEVAGVVQAQANRLLDEGKKRLA
jgi:hypothetical protein